MFWCLCVSLSLVKELSGILVDRNQSQMNFSFPLQRMQMKPASVWSEGSQGRATARKSGAFYSSHFPPLHERRALSCLASSQPGGLGNQGNASGKLKMILAPVAAAHHTRDL